MTSMAFKNARVVSSSWLQEGGRRLDCNPYMSGALDAKEALKRSPSPKHKLGAVASEIFDSGRESRNWVDDPRYGVRYMGSSAISLADLSTLPLISQKQVARNPRLILQEGWSLITRSGTVGRMAYARPDMVGLACSEDVLRVVPDTARIPAGYMYAFLASKFGVPLVVSGTYGAIIQHIEPEHIVDIGVPRFDQSFEDRVSEQVARAALLRSQCQAKLGLATDTLLRYAGLEDCPAHKWIASGPEIGFQAEISQATRTLRAVNYSPKVRALLKAVEGSGARALSEICSGGQLSTGARFKRIDCEPSEGVRLVGQKQGFWVQPEGRWIASRYAPSGIFASNESVLIASSGTLGENEVYCRPILVTGRWLEYAYTQHFLRVVSGDPTYPGAYIFAFLRSEIAFRALRSMSTGSKQQEIHVGLVAGLPVPTLTLDRRLEIAEIVREAFRERDAADVVEEQAITAVERAIVGE